MSDHSNGASQTSSHGGLAQTSSVQFPIPEIPQADRTRRTLDMQTFQGEPWVHIAPWPSMALRQRYWVRISGTQETGDGYVIHLAGGEPVNSEHLRRGVDVLINRLYLDTLKHGASFTVAVKVSFTDSDNESLAVDLPLAHYTLLKGATAATAITSVTDAGGRAVPDNGSTRSQPLTLKGRASANQALAILDGTQQIGSSQANANGDWTSSVGGLSVARHVFRVRGNRPGDPLSAPWNVNVLESTNERCEDFSALSVGYRFPDNVKTPLGSGLIVRPFRMTSGRSVQAQIVKVQSGNALYVDLEMATGERWNRLHLHIPYETPLAKAVTIKLVYEGRASQYEARLSAIWQNLKGGSPHQVTAVKPGTGGEFSLTVPAGAHLTDGEILLVFNVDYTPPMLGFGKYNITSVCWTS